MRRCWTKVMPMTTKTKPEQHEGFMAIAQHHVDRPAGHQQQEHRFRCDLRKQTQHAAGSGDRQLVRTELFEAPTRFCLG